jgi:hypothetical protein
MERLTISFYDEIAQKLNKRAAKKNISVAQYIRDLVNIGLRVEEMSEQKKSENDGNDPLQAELETLKKLQRKGLDSSYESLYIVRHILINLLEEDPKKHVEILDMAKVKSKSFVDGLLGEET